MKRKTYVGLKAQGMGFDAHLTLIYTGEVDYKTQNSIEVTIREASKSPLYAERKSIDMFGPDRTISVLKVVPSPDLWELYKYTSKHIKSISRYDWNPHITLKLGHNETVHIPRLIELTDLGFY